MKLIATYKVIGMDDDNDKHRVYQELKPNALGVFPEIPCACTLHQKLRQEEAEAHGDK